MLAIGVKLKVKIGYSIVLTMVFLKDLKSQWPWNPSDTNMSDKEIYTHTVKFEDASKKWRIPVLPPMPGFAYTGMRVVVFEKPSDYRTSAHLVYGETNRPIFGLTWDISSLKQGEWSPLGYPLTNKIIAIYEDGIDSIVEHTEPCWGKVEFVAQRFEDLLEDESGMSYVFLNNQTGRIQYILNSKNLLFKPDASIDGPYYNQRSKYLPTIHRLLDCNQNSWLDTSAYLDKIPLHSFQV